MSFYKTTVYMLLGVGWDRIIIHLGYQVVDWQESADESKDKEAADVAGEGGGDLENDTIMSS